MSTAEVAQMITAAIQPMITALNQQTDERINRIIGESNQRIQLLEQEIAALRAASTPVRRGNVQKSMMDMKAFQKIAIFKDGHAKWKTVRVQIESLAEIAFPGAGRKTLKWAQNLGASPIEYLEGTGEFAASPPNGVSHEFAHHIGQELAITLSYLTEGEAENMLNNAGEGRGLEARRRLRQRSDPRSNARDLVDTQRSIRPPRCKSMSDALPSLERWEESLRHAT